MSTLYPDAKFILSLRKDEESWWRSIRAHTERRRWVGNGWVFGSEVAEEGDRERWVEVFRGHNEDVRKYFQETARLLEVVVEDEEKNRERVCGFLGLRNVLLMERSFRERTGRGSGGS
jgi:hypothetical protein